MYCGKSSSEGPTQNKLLLDLLWEQYRVKYGVDLLPTTNIMPGTLSNDIECRVIHLKSLIKTLKEKMSPNTPVLNSIKAEIQRANTLIKELEKIKEDTDKFLSTIIDDIDDNKLNDYSNQYVKLLTGNQDNSRTCEHFISICEQLLYYNQKAEFEKYFPLLNYKMNEWERLSGTEEQFQPKIIEAFKAVESGLGHHIIPSIPCRVGFIGNISVGKTSLLNWLRGIRSEEEEEDDNNSQNQPTEDDKDSQNQPTEDKILVSPVRVGKSTYCRLEFEHEYDNGQKIIFVDIEGSTDTDTYLKSANYYDEIIKADCDLYIIVFDHQFTDIQQKWYDYIVNDLHRQCWLVRSKIDKLFREKFKESIRQDFDLVTDAVKNKYGQKIIDEIRIEVGIDIHGKNLSNVYLMFTSCDKNLSRMSYLKDELEKLINDIKNLPLSLHGNRLQTMAVRAMARVINNCFRRGYVVNVMKYKIAAGIAAVVPLGDLIPRYYAREEIRQAFGVNTRSRFMNWISNTKDEFQVYLKEFDIDIDESGFKTSTFNKTFRKNPITIKKTVKEVPSVAIKGATAVGVMGVSMTDDVMRGVGIGAVNAVRGLSTAFIIVGIGLTAAMCAWAAVSNGKQMYKYLNGLCDDLIIVSDHVTKKIIENNDVTRDCYTSTE
jgi:hypothetical protein